MYADSSRGTKTSIDSLKFKPYTIFGSVGGLNQSNYLPEMKRE